MACLMISLLACYGMFFFEAMAIRVQGLSCYLQDRWNWLDVVHFIFYHVYVIIRFYQISLDQDTIDDMDNTSMILTLMEIFILTEIYLKITFFTKNNEKLGLLSKLLLGVMNAVVPFLFVFYLWITYFAQVSAILGANHAEA